MQNWLDVLDFTAAPVVPLTITTDPYTVEVDSGQMVSLVCVAIGTLTPTLAWTSPSGSVILTEQQYVFDQSAGGFNNVISSIA